MSWEEESQEALSKILQATFDLVDLHPEDYRGLQYLAMKMVHGTIQAYARKKGAEVDKICTCALCMGEMAPAASVKRLRDRNAQLMRR